MREPKVGPIGKAEYREVPSIDALMLRRMGAQSPLFSTDERDLWPARDPIDYDQLTPGIRKLVRYLREHGFETTDSGDGVTNVAADMEGALEVPHVHCVVAARSMTAEAHRLHDVIARATGRRDGYSIQATYSPIDGVASVSVFGVLDADLVVPT